MSEWTKKYRLVLKLQKGKDEVMRFRRNVSAIESKNSNMLCLCNGYVDTYFFQKTKTKRPEGSDSVIGHALK